MAKISTLIDTFNDNTFNASLWNDISGAATTEQNGRMEIVKGSGSFYELIESQAAYDLDESGISLQAVNAGDQAGAENEYYPMILNNSVDAQDSIRWGIFNGLLKAFYIVNNSTTMVKGDVAYNSAVHKFFRIRETGGNLFWDYSTDGKTWTQYTTAATPAGVDHTSLKVILSIGSWGDRPATTGIWDNVNYSPSIMSVNKVARANIGAILRTNVGNISRFLGQNI